ncbi:MAG: FAD-dependent oxidoreductase [Thermodesulfobacteriota bacterium]|nr:FAD-dependent oxidoreductase [Thermodesulfobacteriota bacterium]
MAQKDVLIIGGGISGITVALELAQSGISTTLIEREPSLGGLAASFCCKASESCNKCFACVVDKRITDIRQRPDISILTQTELMDVNPVRNSSGALNPAGIILKSNPAAEQRGIISNGVKGNSGKYRISLKKGKEKVDLEASAVVLATGIDPYEASQKAEYGYGRFKNVITAKDLDEMLRFRGKLFRPSDGQLPGNIAFFQCVGSRDESIGNLYCSQACCAYALRLIKAIRHQHSDVKATFLYMDIQPSGASFQQFLTSCREDRGIRFIRSLPSKVYHSPLSDTLRVRFTDPEMGEVIEESFDLIVLSVGMVLRKRTKPLIELLGLNLTEDGFIAPPPPQTGIFIAGACSGPKDIDRSILHAKSTAFLVQQHLNGRF